ncbi:hypothetical protein [Xenorhabdus doucetiae]|nr:hypothetical protein [Xenorhabdus sp. 3]
MSTLFRTGQEAKKAYIDAQSRWSKLIPGSAGTDRTRKINADGRAGRNL